MRIPDARSLLSYEEIKTVTERALKHGAFIIDNVRRIGSHLEVEVTYPKSGAKRKVVLADKKVEIL